MGASNSSQCTNEVRIGHSLNEKEEEFVAMRKTTVLQSLKKLHIYDMNKVPNIALLGSGGGERAMVGLLGSLDQLQKTGLLDCILYLSGVSGSTWCMASLYQEPDWSTKLETVKDKIIQRLSGPGVNWKDTFFKLNKYFYGKEIFSLTDYWAVWVITKFVKEINEHTLTEQWNQLSKDPFPIYTAIDKHCKQDEDADPWFEFTPYEVGYSLTGAFVKTSSFGSEFDNGCKTDNPEFKLDMLYLQALCGSAIADEEENKKFIWEQMKEFSGYKSWLDKLDYAYANLRYYITDPLRPLLKPLKDYSRKIRWSWGRNYNFLYNMSDDRVPSALRKSKTRDYIDAGLLLNSPYFSVLRKERDIDLIISLDFSDGDPFKTVKDAAEMCRKLNIPFPEVNIPDGHSENPKDFYVFKGQDAPTVIHIPLFNVVNCGDDIEDWRNRYKTFQGPYSAEMITELMEVAGRNITNNRAKLLKEIRVMVTKNKLSRWFLSFLT